MDLSPYVCFSGEIRDIIRFYEQRLQKVFQSDDLLQLFFSLMWDSHGNKERKSGGPYVGDHLLQDVVGNMLKFTSSPSLLFAGGNHDYAEDCGKGSFNEALAAVSLQRRNLEALDETLDEVVDNEVQKNLILNPIGLLTKPSDLKIQETLGEIPRDSLILQRIKLDRCLAQNGWEETTVLDKPVTLEERVSAALVYLPDLWSNGNPEEEYISGDGGGALSFMGKKPRNAIKLINYGKTLNEFIAKNVESCENIEIDKEEYDLFIMKVIFPRVKTAIEYIEGLREESFMEELEECSSVAYWGEFGKLSGD